MALGIANKNVKTKGTIGNTPVPYDPIKLGYIALRLFQQPRSCIALHYET